ncbi:MAG TPA: helix-hairpin-helix domain-containing protein [Candidatus Saccharimonadales bacterium]|nr:helix-hairpin-helix domain-containing protein [Candidatus Saccharimonadales bacterium]
MVRQAVRSIAASLLLVAILAVAGASGVAAAGQAHDGAVAKIDINHATAEELQQLPGVGPSLAQRIVDFREKNGPFGSVDELLKVRGIGEKSLERFRHLVTAGKGK